jgi:biotin transport system permease protein
VRVIALHRPGDGFLHRTPSGVKLVGLAVVALVLALYPHDALSIAVILVLVFGLFAAAAVPVRWAVLELWRLRGVLAVLAVMLAVFVSPGAAWISTGRVAALVLLAALVTMTTTMTDLLASLRAVLRPLRRVGVDPDAASFGISLTLTTVPVVAGLARRVRDAERARGVRLGPRAAVPLLVLALRHADGVGDALAARGIA